MWEDDGADTRQNPRDRIPKPHGAGAIRMSGLNHSPKWCGDSRARILPDRLSGKRGGEVFRAGIEKIETGTGMETDEANREEKERVVVDKVVDRED